jgi:hypothetical protein
MRKVLLTIRTWVRFVGPAYGIVAPMVGILCIGFYSFMALA